MIRLIIVLGMIFIFSLTGAAQSSADSLYSEAKALVDTKSYDGVFDMAATAAQSYLEQEKWDSAQDAIQLITKLPYDSIQVKRLEDFIAKEKTKLRPVHPIEASNLNTLNGAFHARNGQYNVAMSHYEKAAKELYALNDTQYLHLVYYRIGQLKQFGQSDGVGALDYAEQAERVNAKKKIQTQEFEGRIHYLRGVAYRSLDWEKSIFHYRKVQEINEDPYGGYENEITKSLLDLGRYEEAYESAKIASKKFFNRYKGEYGEYLIYEALALDGLKKYDEAIKTIEKAAKIMEADFVQSDPNFIKAFFYKALIYGDSGNFDEALENCQKVYALSLPSYRVSSQYDVPHIDSTSTNQWVLYALVEQGKILIQKYEKTKDPIYLEYAINAGLGSINDINNRRQKLENWDSKKMYNDFIYVAYEQALYASVLLFQSQPNTNNRNKVLALLKKSKATLLQEDRSRDNQRSHIPPEILKEENDLNSSIAKLETQIQREQHNGSSEHIATIKNQLFHQRIALEDFKKKHRQYYALLNDDTTEAHENMEMLPAKTAVIAFQMYRDKIIVLAIDKEELHLDIVPKDINFENSIINMRKTLSDWNLTLSNTAESENIITYESKNIGSSLLNLISKFGNQIDHIVIMPDGMLHSIPFELLSLPQSEDRMIDAYDISYAYLFSSLPDTSLQSREVSTFAGFAPEYIKELDSPQENDAKMVALRSGLIDIPEARKITLDLADRFAGESWVNKKATKAQFVKQAKNYDILHLGMHSLLNEHTNSLSSLVFYEDEDHELHLNEVQSMHIPASMVVLSACNTGVGRNVVGEGPLSLARSFFYAGAESTLMSLWQVPDEQTSRIMRLFYNNIEAGLDKSKALSEAKREYLKTASKIDSHPAFWSGFVLVGNSEPLNIKKGTGLNHTYILFALIIIVGLTIGYKMRNS